MILLTVIIDLTVDCIFKIAQITLLLSSWNTFLFQLHSWTKYFWNGKHKASIIKICGPIFCLFRTRFLSNFFSYGFICIAFHFAFLYVFIFNVKELEKFSFYPSAPELPRLVNCMLWSELSFSFLAHVIYGKLWATLLLWMNNHAAQDAVKAMMLNWLKKASAQKPNHKRIKSRTTQSFRGMIQFAGVLIQWYLWNLGIKLNQVPLKDFGEKMKVIQRVNEFSGLHNFKYCYSIYFIYEQSWWD